VDEEGHSVTMPHLNGLKNGDTANSAIKQIASGRFGVTPEYLMSGKQLEIKIAKEQNREKEVNYRGKKSVPILPCYGDQNRVLP
jgi:glutamate synthase (ferredoxin)